MNKIPEKINGYNMYDQGEKLIGITGDVELPNLESMTATISGAGILGEVESPIVGHFPSLVMTIPYRTITKDSARISEPKHQILTLRADQNSYDVSQGQISHQGLKIVVGGTPKAYTPGTVRVGEGTGTQVVLEVVYYKITLENEVLLELDKYNYIYVVNGVDYLAEVRKNI